MEHGMYYVNLLVNLLGLHLNVAVRGSTWESEQGLEVFLCCHLSF